MSRSAGMEFVPRRPTNNIYTVLVIAGTLAAVLALVVVYLRANALFPPNGLGFFGG